MLLRIVALSLAVSGSACLLACGFGLLLGAWLAVARFPGRRAVLLGAQHPARAAFGGGRPGRLPAAVALRPARLLGWLFTLKAMVLAQAILVLPVVTALTRQVVEDATARRRRAAALARAPARCSRAAAVLLHERYALRHGADRRLRPRRLGSRRGDDRRRQHRRLHARDDHRHRAGDQQGRPAAGAGAGPGAAGGGAVAQRCDRAAARLARAWRRRAADDGACVARRRADRAARRGGALRRRCAALRGVDLRDRRAASVSR